MYGHLRSATTSFPACSYAAQPTSRLDRVTESLQAASEVCTTAHSKVHANCQAIHDNEQLLKQTLDDDDGTAKNMCARKSLPSAITLLTRCPLHVGRSSCRSVVRVCESLGLDELELPMLRIFLLKAGRINQLVD